MVWRASVRFDGRAIGENYPQGSRAMKTLMKSYRLLISDATDRAEYERIVAKMTSQNVKCFRALGAHKDAYYHAFAADGAEIELETRHIFDNQWNTAPIPCVSETGLRVFDWAEYAAESAGMSRNYKCGHYLEITPEMCDLRAKRGQCGYCGKQFTLPYGDFCDACAGSEYLDADTLKRGATRIYPVMARNEWRALTPEESAKLLPAWREAQIYGRTAQDKKRIADLRARLRCDYETKQRTAEMEYNGLIWLLDRGINTANFIFYAHTETFSLGWRQTIAPECRDEWCETLREFPFPWKFSEGR